MSSLRNDEYLLTGEDDEGLLTKTKRYPHRCYYFVAFLMLVGVVTAVALFFSGHFDSSNSTKPSKTPWDHADLLLQNNLLFDGHNDLPWQYRSQFNDSVWTEMDLRQDQSLILQTDIPRLQAGRVGAQFWSVYMDCPTQYSDAVRTTMEQVDVVYKMAYRYPDYFEVALTAADVQRIYGAGKIASLIGIEGGHSIDSSLGALRQFYNLGVRYMTLTHNCNTPWADSCVGPTEFKGLTDFGRDIVLEMNRIGMLVDLSHVSPDTMHSVLNVSRSPVYFSHSSVYTLCPTARNVPDDVLLRLPENGGVISITFVSTFIRCDGVRPNVSDVANHIDYIKNLLGNVDNIAIGGDYDGVTNLPIGLEDVSTYPNLFAELVNRGYTDDEIIAIAGGNTLRILTENEEIAHGLQSEGAIPGETVIFPNVSCRSGPPGSTAAKQDGEKENQETDMNEK